MGRRGRSRDRGGVGVGVEVRALLPGLSSRCVSDGNGDGRQQNGRDWESRWTGKSQEERQGKRTGGW